MQKQKGMNKHQKAVYKVGERHTSREEIAELLVLSQSESVEDRLCAAEHLCPCHVRSRVPAVWEALFRMMEDADARPLREEDLTTGDTGKYRGRKEQEDLTADDTDKADERKLEKSHKEEPDFGLSVLIRCIR